MYKYRFITIFLFATLSLFSLGLAALAFVIFVVLNYFARFRAFVQHVHEDAPLPDLGFVDDSEHHFDVNKRLKHENRHRAYFPAFVPGIAAPLHVGVPPLLLRREHTFLYHYLRDWRNWFNRIFRGEWKYKCLCSISVDRVLPPQDPLQLPGGGPEQDVQPIFPVPPEYADYDFSECIRLQNSYLGQKPRVPIPAHERPVDGAGLAMGPVMQDVMWIPPKRSVLVPVRITNVKPIDDEGVQKIVHLEGYVDWTVVRMLSPRMYKSPIQVFKWYDSQSVAWVCSNQDVRRWTADFVCAQTANSEAMSQGFGVRPPPQPLGVAS